MITQQLICELFDYKDGNLYWKVKTSKKIIIGDKVGCLGNDGYIRVKINKKSYLLHRLIFCMFNGYMPKNADHKDCNKSNNRIENLREATPSQNSCNRKIVSNNTSGVKNISWHKLAKKWHVRVTVNKKLLNLGLFEDLELAELVAIEAKHKFHGNFARI